MKQEELTKTSFYGDFKLKKPVGLCGLSIQIFQPFKCLPTFFQCHGFADPDVQ